MIYIIKNIIRGVSHKNKIINKIYIKANSIKVNLLARLSDEQFAKIKYKENTGKKLNLDNPKTFNEKLWWLKLNNRDPLLTICSDKVKVRGYVENHGLKHILNELYYVYDSVDEIKWEDLPEKAFIKTNHGSGTNMLWNKKLPFNMKKFNKNFNNSLEENYYLQSREWNYKNIQPKIIVEKVLEVKKDKKLIDYRFFCFDGEVKLIFVDIETTSIDGSHSPYAKRNIYDPNFKLLNIKAKREHFPEDLISKPHNLDVMIEYAERLSSPFVFCRVDLYNIDGKIIFGEITFYPGGATQLIEPLSWERKIGNWINLDSDKILLDK